MTNLGDPGVKQELSRRLEALKASSQALWGKMTAHGMLCHLSDSFEVGLGERIASPASGPFQRTVIKWGALYFPARWPRGVPSRPEVIQGLGGTPPADFVEDRNRLLRAMDRFCDPTRRLEALHPTFGRLSQRQWMRWGYLHADHHLRQFGV